MPRITEARVPAAPTSERQAARWERMLEAAAALGAETPYELVQMQEIAKAADVAVGTLYRYFPSKAQLFAALYEARIARFVQEAWPPADGDPVKAVGERLVALSHSLLEQSLLCSSMVQATAVNYSAQSESEMPVAESSLCRAVLRTLGSQDPDRDRATAVRMLVYSWWGVLVSRLSGRTSDAVAAYQIELAARLLLTEDTSAN